MRIKRKTFNLWKKRFFIFLGICFVFSFFYIYFRTSLLSITSYELIGIPEHYQETIQKNLRSIAGEKMYKLFPGNRVLSYHSMLIKSSIASLLPNVDTVTLRPVGLHTLRVSVTTFTPLFRIGQDQAITKEGYVYKEINDVTSLPELVLATSSQYKNIEKDGINYSLVSGIDDIRLSEMSGFLSKVITVLFPVTKIAIDEFGDISFFDEKGIGRITFSKAADYTKLWSNLLSAVDTEPLKTKIDKNKDTLEYIDLRFGNKVFYKFTNISKTAIIESHATTTEATTTLPQ